MWLKVIGNFISRGSFFLLALVGKKILLIMVTRFPETLVFAVHDLCDCYSIIVCQASFKGDWNTLLMVMYLGAPHRKRSCPCIALFRSVGDTGPWCWLVWGGLFFRKRGYQQGRIGFLDRQHLSITELRTSHGK